MADRARKTDYDWEGLGAGAALIANLTTIPDIQVIVQFLASVTLYRIRGEILATLTTAAAANSAKILHCGLIMASAEAAAAGAASIPDPASDLNAPWIWHGFMHLMRTATTETESFGLASYRLQVDSKAMRKIKANQSLVFAVSPQNLAGSETAQIFFGFRALFGS